MTEDMTLNEEVIEDLTVAGVVDTAIGADELDAAGDAASMAMAATAAAASDLTRAVDAEVVADRLGALSEMVGDAGITDISQGIEMLTASEDVEAMAAVVGLMSLGDVEREHVLAGLDGPLPVVPTSESLGGQASRPLVTYPLVAQPRDHDGSSEPFFQRHPVVVGTGYVLAGHPTDDPTALQDGGKPVRIQLCPRHHRTSQFLGFLRQ